MIHPLQPLAPIQRLGWLKHFSRIKCAKSFARFVAGALYDVTVENVGVSHEEIRIRHDGDAEMVTLSGSDLLIKIADGEGEKHRFLAAPKSKLYMIHDLPFLVEHFHIPAIPDLGAMRPRELEALKKKLRALES